MGYMDKLGKIDAAKKVWVGGLNAKTTWKTLEKHFNELLGEKPGVTEILPKGKACLAFETEDAASNAIATVNGSELDGKTLEVDVWTQKEKKERPQGEKKKKTSVKVLKTAFAKKALRTDLKLKEKLEKIDNELKVWVGGLNRETKAGALRKHFTEAGCKPHLLNLTGKDRACVSFKTAEEATEAISTMNATELDNKTIEVDEWKKLEKKDKT